VIGLNLFAIDAASVSRVLHDADGNVRAALLCWGIAVSAFVVLRIPRQILLACLVAATATVGLSLLMADVAPENADSSSSKSLTAPASYRAAPPRSYWLGHD
jgi:hypothetical protein